MRLKSRSAERLVALLRRIQSQQGLTRAQFARRLGVSVSMLDMVYGGWRSPGSKFLRGVLQAYPELRQEVALFLSADICYSELFDDFR